MAEPNISKILNERLEDRLRGERRVTSTADRAEFQGALTELEIVMKELGVPMRPELKEKLEHVRFDRIEKKRRASKTGGK